MSKVNRNNVTDIGPEQESKLSPWAQGLKEGIYLAAKKGRITQEDADSFRGLIYRGMRRPLQKNRGGRHPLDLLEEMRQCTISLLMADSQQLRRTIDNADDPNGLKFPWKDYSEWLCNHMPQLWKEAVKLMVQYPIPL